MCTVTCGGGVSFRSRTCNSEDDDLDCMGPATENFVCNDQVCQQCTGSFCDLARILIVLFYVC